MAKLKYIDTTFFWKLLLHYPFRVWEQIVRFKLVDSGSTTLGGLVVQDCSTQIDQLKVVPICLSVVSESVNVVRGRTNV